MTPAEVDAELARYLPADPEQQALVAGHRAHLAAHPGSDRFDGSDVSGGFTGSALHRDGPSAHLTATAFVLSPGGDHALLVLHRRFGLWLQPGGHLEAGDVSLLAAARREAAEETGLGELLRPALGGSVVDVQRHRLPGTFVRCTEHLDVGYLFTAPAEAVPEANEESERAAWFTVEEVLTGRDDVIADLAPRLERARDLLRG